MLCFTINASKITICSWQKPILRTHVHRCPQHYFYRNILHNTGREIINKPHKTSNLVASCCRDHEVKITVYEHPKEGVLFLKKAVVTPCCSNIALFPILMVCCISLPPVSGGARQFAQHTICKLRNDHGRFSKEPIRNLYCKEPIYYYHTHRRPTLRNSYFHLLL